MAGRQRPGVVLIIALVMLWASARHIMAGDLTLNGAAARILVAIRLASVDVAILLTITAGYHGQVAERVETPRRRRDDLEDGDEVAADRL
jgi:hypothetical protein